MRRKRKKPLPRGKLRDNSKSISVRMTEEQFLRLERYRELTRLPVTTYFRKLIAESEIMERPSRVRFRLYEEVNKIDSNIRQISAESPRKGTGPGGGGQNPFPAGTHSRTGLPHKRTP
ncbi:MAG: hypothetical protein BHV94_03470 [Clostridiales bacterium 59_14]|nr:MAG: hypothetical protein BHV94_03470 [Clostridiales bacterium 59_14]